MAGQMTSQPPKMVSSCRERARLFIQFNFFSLCPYRTRPKERVPSTSLLVQRWGYELVCTSKCENQFFWIPDCIINYQIDETICLREAGLQSRFPDFLRKTSITMPSANIPSKTPMMMSTKITVPLESPDRRLTVSWDGLKA